MKLLLVDNYDSYSYNLRQLLGAITGCEPEVVRNDAVPLGRVVAGEFDAVVISPGPGRPERERDFGSCAELIREFDGPVLGVCLGLQGIVHAFGGEVVPAPAPVHGRTATIGHDGGPLFAGIPAEFEGVRYHSLTVAEPLPACLRVTARADDGVVMAVEHRERPLWGVQFHPESIGTACGERLLRNFVALVEGRRGARRIAQPAVQPPPPAPRRLPVPQGFRIFERELAAVPDPARAFTALFGADPYAFWLDGQGEGAGETVLGTAAGPGGEVLCYRAGEGAVRALNPLDGSEERLPGSVFEVLRRRLAERRVEGGSEGFAGGYAGYLGYELKADLGSPGSHRAATPDACLMFASRAVVIDRVAGTARALCVAPPATSATQAEAALDEIAARLARLDREPHLVEAEVAQTVAGSPEFGLSRAEYVAAVEAAQRALHAGESYEVCLTDTVALELDEGVDPLALYLRQRRASPAPYGAFMRMGETALLSSSPERFLRVDAAGNAESKPIKGTRPRGASAVEDLELRAELAASVKDRAENMMVVDLVRNDLGRVCETGSVTVPALMAVESFAHVHQLVSTVRGRLAPDRDALDCVAACFPAGSMTGAPKLRTMEVIDALEAGPRGVYSGAHGYFGLRGEADLGVVIRSIVLDGGRATIGGGGAVTVLSDPEAEHEEMLLKVEPLLRLLGSRAAAGLAA